MNVGSYELLIYLKLKNECGMELSFLYSFSEGCTGVVVFFFFFFLKVDMSITIDFGYVPPSIEVLAVFRRGGQGGGSLKKKKLGKKKKKKRL